jgi:hypothetical protein
MVDSYCGTHGGVDKRELLRRFVHMNVSTTDEFNDLFLASAGSTASMQARTQALSPSLLIIDSLAGLFRSSFSESAAPTPPHFFHSLSVSLKSLGFHVVCINQVMGTEEPCFGRVWRNCINDRIHLKRYHGAGSEENAKWIREYRIEGEGKGRGEYRIEDWGVVSC